MAFGTISLAAAETATTPPATHKPPAPPPPAETPAATNPPSPAPTPAPNPAPTTPNAPADNFAFEQFPASDGLYVLNTRTGTVQAITVQGQTCSFPFAGLETVAADRLTTPGRFRGSLVQNALFVLDRQTGVLEKVLLSNLTKTVVLGAGAQPGAATPGAGAPPTHGGAATPTSAEGHLPPPPQYTTVKVPEKITAADRQDAERNIDDYSAFLGYPYLGAPIGTGYQLEVRIANRGTRTLAALEVTVEYRDPKDNAIVQQRFYFRRDNGETNAPPGPGLERTMTLQLPAFADAPDFKIFTSYLAFAD